MTVSLKAKTPANAGATRAVTRLAPAKINLALHVTGRRDDGYHLLDMLVVFARHGDVIRIELAQEDSFTVSGPFASGVPLDGGNLVLRAREALRGETRQVLPPVAIHLEKNLPIASGIGGGSSDAAATLLALDELWSLDLGFERLASIGLGLGADLPMCLHGASKGTPLAARGIGEELAPVAGFPALPMLLVNDGTAVATPDVFRALEKRDHPALALAAHPDIGSLCAYLRTTRNDLLSPALKLAPPIGAKLNLLRESGSLHAQMSGSGATCYAIYDNIAAAERVAERLSAERPDWFVTATQSVPS
ncbi:4-diphosphocytidyl-2-C-methyl-D-erythritol kinase [Ochrobactrum sp. J50]|jgi:4-diphosphocytidyl-2-C-methyl-D-erythritol kinase|uniref:4-diphosphocytidyl-2-C-methyl-D-erythritol kinase n=1 Tax=Brucella pseudintermedia TaxID=370111 RepID=A0ABY5U9X0_9HYPH|nr:MULTISPECIES: 4-(cytidine 5'-diphospho)-2-C-methyl-D-erythritol kinase [Brucella/Ochrobactrum group]KAB2682183.1 4-(cytidine 5'-diphospho)-2-C-methyl-D-erythritol kinase [Brucella pseudintermedia]NKE75737.1 4-(cytidine 5'-diphospho)-2-C-methyl-D-erythritol kinase [Ochrobactrum sp. MC-1LL]TWH02199.1 4-diphosphocytidyl-2-C-methyl-D-erythritol kinase [Ochrobactrum sp. J50]UWL60126.1 4-(cytidine 5'-diphospho)-2-C-methyl-D-erythritol kinase [Brucella pseudintermedia]WPM80547.1 4-(cytidine 5'-dip